MYLNGKIVTDSNCFRLKSGWSIKTANLNQWKQPDPLSEDEHQKILDVITQAEMLEKAEQERVG